MKFVLGKWPASCLRKILQNPLSLSHVYTYECVNMLFTYVRTNVVNCA